MSLFVIRRQPRPYGSGCLIKYRKDILIINIILINILASVWIKIYKYKKNVETI